jgi:hypothetical protein
MKEENNILLLMNFLMKNDLENDIEFEILAFNIVKKLCEAVDSFLSFKKIYNEITTHNLFIY